MKRVLFLFTVFLFLLGCSTTQEVNFGLSTYSLSFGAESSTKEISITCNIPWEITDTPGWITLSQYEGDGNTELKVTTAQNETGGNEKRNAYFSQRDEERQYDATNLDPD